MRQTSKKSRVLAKSSRVAQPGRDENFNEAHPVGLFVRWATAGTVVSGEQNSESKDDGERSLAQANRKSLHPKGRTVNNEEFRGSHIGATGLNLYLLRSRLRF